MDNALTSEELDYTNKTKIAISGQLPCESRSPIFHEFKKVDIIKKNVYTVLYSEYFP